MVWISFLKKLQKTFWHDLWKYSFKNSLREDRLCGGKFWDRVKITAAKQVYFRQEIFWELLFKISKRLKLPRIVRQNRQTFHLSMTNLGFTEFFSESLGSNKIGLFVSSFLAIGQDFWFKISGKFTQSSRDNISGRRFLAIQESISGWKLFFGLE